MSSESPRLKLALFGLGRLGAIRANILVHFSPRIELVAASDPKPGAGEWASQNLPASVKFYADPIECMEKSGAQAVLVSTATATHAPLVLKALDLGLVSLSAQRHRLQHPGLIINSTSCARSQLRWTYKRPRRSSRKPRRILN